MLATLRRIVLVLFSLYLLACVLLYFRQSQFIFVPQREVEFTPKDYGCAFEDVHLPLDSKPKALAGWWVPAEPGAAAAVGNRGLLYLHGNGGSVGANAAHACRLSHIGFSVLIVDYRGYGNSDGGPPTEKSVYDDAEQAWQYLAHKVNPQSIVIYGHSLGGAVAIEIAHRHPEASALIAESTFTSIADMAGQNSSFRLFPIVLILNQRMESIDKIRSIHMPVLLIHGMADRVIPSSMSEHLYAAANQPKQLLLVPHAGHDNSAEVAGSRYGKAIREFLAPALTQNAASASDK